MGGYSYPFTGGVVQKGQFNVAHLLGLEREDDTVDDTRILKVLAARNSGPTETSLLWDWNTGQFRELSGDDL